MAQNGAAGLGASIPTAVWATNPNETLLLVEKEKQLREEMRRNLVIVGIPESDNLNGIKSPFKIDITFKNETFFVGYTNEKGFPTVLPTPIVNAKNCQKQIA